MPVPAGCLGMVGLNNGFSMAIGREITYDDGIWNSEYSCLLQYRIMELPRHGGFPFPSKIPIVRP